MTIKTIHTILFLLVCSFAQTVYAQEKMIANWESQKIRGTRNLPYHTYIGSPFLNDVWVIGEIEFTNGEIIDSLNLRYSSYKDELIYFNKDISTQIVIDKASLNGFSFIGTDGNERVFRKQYYENYLKSDRYFEVLSEGETDLLVYRKVNLELTSPYSDKSGKMKNQEYIKDYQFYFYSPEKKYTSVRISRNGLFAKFDKASQKPIKKLLRKNRIKIESEADFIQAWKVLEKEGYKVVF